eukprot:GHVR01089109.1.p1 GENE.GHVR01089109.1~~GHVR01089109.1.p1  ORF type:complete len:111 (+),score=10.89 GHVR01089109.1:498-830(+)
MCGYLYTRVCVSFILIYFIYFYFTCMNSCIYVTILCLCVGGCNSCCFAYGPTGGGKTYSIFGEAHDDNIGLLPRVIQYLFYRLEAMSNNWNDSFLLRDLSRRTKGPLPAL